MQIISHSLILSKNSAVLAIPDELSTSPIISLKAFLVVADR